MTIEEALRNERIGSLSLPRPACVRPEATLGETLAIMRREGVGAVLVCDGPRLVGIFTERDVLNKMFGAPVAESEPIERFMTRDPATLAPDNVLGDAVSLMTERGYRHIPLRQPAGERVGMIVARDIVHYIAEHFPAEVVNLPPGLVQEFTTPEGA